MALTAFYHAPAQTPEVDSLKRQIAVTSNSNKKLALLDRLLADAYSLQSDTLYLYASATKVLAEQLGNHDMAVAADFYIANFLRREGYSDSSLKLANSRLRKLTFQHDQVNYSRFRLFQIDVISESGNSHDGIDTAYNLLQDAENARDTALQIQLLSRIGSMYSDIGQYSQGLSWFREVQQLAPEPRFDKIKNNCVLFFNIGLDYNYLGRFDSAEYYADKTIAVSKANENLLMYAYGLGLKSYVYSYTNRPALAEKPINESVRILKQFGGLYSVINAMSAMARYYASMGQPAKGVQTCLDALDLLKKYPIVPKEIIYNQLAENYKAAGEWKQYAETLGIIIRLKDSSYKKNSADALADMNAKYQVSSKEAFIAKQKLELLHKNLWITGIVAMAIFAVMVVYALFLLYRRRQKMAVADAEEKERKRIAADLHDNIGAYAAAISAGIEEIEGKKLITDEPAVSFLKNNASEIISSLRDTIWAFNKESVTISGISDRLKVYMQKIQPSYPHVELSVNENIARDKRLSPVQALHIFRIVQEAIHNALVHSRAVKVWVNVSSQGEQLQINIVDDGMGFDIAGVTKRGNGLQNMQTRAREAGFLFSIERWLPHGTTVVVRSM